MRASGSTSGHPSTTMRVSTDLRADTQGATESPTVGRSTFSAGILRREQTQGAIQGFYALFYAGSGAGREIPVHK
jgi:hypothetical protein